ncbi:phosphotriesterase [Kitasatospora aureofaciens]|uniref:phosphotriesterase family protein n=1 Tax=Kitasatospora aureofaciens TaxID=1894 RepID=UPI001C476F41|nr:phosphotriesterase [Kitasatospora aureofaciens]MBV6697833.1 phosphotriesterase [Kitasatospora aureofaciens]
MTPSHPRPAVRTILGDLDPAELGVTDSHDHLFIRSPLLAGEELDDPAAAEDVLHAFAAAGGRSLVQWTPYGMGRGADSLAKLSRATGVHVVAATGVHQAAHYAPDTFPALYDGLAERFTAELTTGLTTESTTGLTTSPRDEPEPVRAGLIKVACDVSVTTAHTRRVMTAAADAHHATGAPIAVHLEPGADPHFVLHWLHTRHQVPRHRIILGHLTRLPDVRLHRELAAEGVFLALDSPSRAGHPADHQAFDLIADLVEAGHAAQLLLGADTTTRTARRAAGPTRLLTDLAPRLARTFGPELPELLLTTNPAAAFATLWRTP